MEKQIRLEATSPNHLGTVSVRFTYPKEMQTVFNVMFKKIEITPIVVEGPQVDDYVIVKFKCKQVELNLFKDMLNIMDIQKENPKKNDSSNFLYLN